MVSLVPIIAWLAAVRGAISRARLCHRGNEARHSTRRPEPIRI